MSKLSTKLYHFSKGTIPMPECKNFKKEFNASPAKEYKCPDCLTRPPEDSYFELEEVYPKFFNENRSSNMDGANHDWDELHCCKKCKTLFYFSNGI